MTSWPVGTSVPVQAGGGAGPGKLTLDNGHDGALLDGGGALETVGVDSTEELGLQVHRVERVGRLIVVGLDLACVWVSLGSPNALRGRRRRGPSLTLRHILKTLVSHDCAVGAGDYWRCPVVGKSSRRGWTRRLLWMPPLVCGMGCGKLDTRSSARESTDI